MSPASITAQHIELAGGEVGRVHLSGEISARDDSPAGKGGEIDITGSILVLAGAKLDASGTLGGGTGDLFREPLTDRGSQASQNRGHVVLDFDSFNLTLAQDGLAVDVQLLGQLVYSQLLSQPISLCKWPTLSAAGYSGSFA